MNVIHLHKGTEPPAKSHFQPSIYSTNANTTWIALAQDWVPAEELPEADLDHQFETDTKKQKGWFGPLGIYDTTNTKTIFDNTESISLSMFD